MTLTLTLYGDQVRMGRLQNLLSSACMEHLDLVNQDLSSLPPIKQIKENKNLYAGYQSLTDIPKIMEITEEYHDFRQVVKNIDTSVSVSERSFDQSNGILAVIYFFIVRCSF